MTLPAVSRKALVNVAQYVADASQLYILIDDPPGNVLYAFGANTAQTHKGLFSGVITTFTANQPSSIVGVKCTSTSI
jgi:hypothetical protein